MDVDAVGKYRDVDYYLNHKWYDFIDDTLQEMYYEAFCLYIDSINVYNLNMPVSVDAYITHEGKIRRCKFLSVKSKEPEILRFWAL